MINSRILQTMDRYSLTSSRMISAYKKVPRVCSSMIHRVMILGTEEQKRRISGYTSVEDLGKDPDLRDYYMCVRGDISEMCTLICHSGLKNMTDRIPFYEQMIKEELKKDPDPNPKRGVTSVDRCVIHYTDRILKSRWPDMEEDFLRHSKENESLFYTILYNLKYMKCRWPELEDTLIAVLKEQDISAATLEYISKYPDIPTDKIMLFLDGLDDDDAAVVRLISSRPDIQITDDMNKIIKHVAKLGDQGVVENLAFSLKERHDVLEDRIVQYSDRDTVLDYINDKVKGPWPMAEMLFFGHEYHMDAYQKIVEKYK